MHYETPVITKSFIDNYIIQSSFITKQRNSAYNEVSFDLQYVVTNIFTSGYNELRIQRNLRVTNSDYKLLQNIVKNIVVVVVVVVI